MRNISKLEHELYDACRKGDLEKVKHYIEIRGAEPSSLNKHGLYVAALSGNIQLVEYLTKEMKFNLHSKNEQVLEAAIYKSNYELIDYCIKENADFRNINIVKKILRHTDIEMLSFFLNKGLEESIVDENSNFFNYIDNKRWWNNYKEKKKLLTQMNEDMDYFEENKLIIKKEVKTKKTKI